MNTLLHHVVGQRVPLSGVTGQRVPLSGVTSKLCYKQARAACASQRQGLSGVSVTSKYCTVLVQSGCYQVSGSLVGFGYVRH